MIYIDDDYKCHTADGEGLRPVEVPFFDGKADYFIESYRFIPAGERWVNPVGIIYRGEMLAPWRNYSVAATAQEAFEQAKDEDAELFGIIEGTVDINDED